MLFNLTFGKRNKIATPLSSTAQPHSRLLTDIETLGHVTVGRSLKVVFVLVGHKFANAAHEPIEHGQHLGRGDVSGAAQEHGLSEGDAREEALQMTRTRFIISPLQEFDICKGQFYVPFLSLGDCWDGGKGDGPGRLVDSAPIKWARK